MTGTNVTFFYVAGGVILMLTGALQLVVRPRKPGEHRWLNRGTVWAGFCLAAGLGIVLWASGLMPAGRP
jgi:hypothetical protein